MTGMRNAYFLWLCDLAGLDPPQGLSFLSLASLLFRTEYYSVLGNDDNRGADGKKLRFYFCNQSGLKQSEVIPELDGPCSVLEMLVGLAVRIDEWLTGELFTGEKSEGVRGWAWVMIRNLGLDKYDDRSFIMPGVEDRVGDIVRFFLDRKYGPDGVGGMFPLTSCDKNMHKIEIWAQFNEYLKENPELIL